jgi:hypothetical protein
MKEFFKKYGIFIVVGVVAILLLILTIILLTRSAEEDPETPVVVPTVPGSIDYESTIVEQPLGYHKNYTINLSSQARNSIDQFQGEYTGFKVKDEDHFSLIDSFVKDIGKGSLEKSKSAPRLDMTIYYWQNEKDSVSYNLYRDVLFMSFEQPIVLSKVSFNPREKEKISKDLESFMEQYFSLNFSYKTHDVSIQGNFYRVDLFRSLEGVPVNLQMQKEYLLLTPDGRLKEATLLLAEFEPAGKLSLISSNDFVSKVSTKEYPKDVDYTNLDPSIDARYEPYGYKVEANQYTQEGVVEVSNVEKVYLYADKSQQIVVPTFLLTGEGLLDVDGTSARADFTILASALKSENVFVHPQSHFDDLENNQ